MDSCRELLDGSQELSRELPSEEFSRELPSTVDAGDADDSSKSLPPANPGPDIVAQSPPERSVAPLAPSPRQASRNYKLAGGTGESHSPPVSANSPHKTSVERVHMVWDAHPVEEAGDGSPQAGGVGGTAMFRTCQSCPPAERCEENPNLSPVERRQKSAERRSLLADTGLYSPSSKGRPVHATLAPPTIRDPRTPKRSRAARQALLVPADNTQRVQLGHLYKDGAESLRVAPGRFRGISVCYTDNPPDGSVGRPRAPGSASVLPPVVDVADVEDNLEWVGHLTDVRNSLGRVRFADMSSYMVQQRPNSSR